MECLSTKHMANMYSANNASEVVQWKTLSVLHNGTLRTTKWKCFQSKRLKIAVADIVVPYRGAFASFSQSFFFHFCSAIVNYADTILQTPRSCVCFFFYHRRWLSKEKEFTTNAWLRGMCNAVCITCWILAWYVSAVKPTREQRPDQWNIQSVAAVR